MCYVSLLLSVYLAGPMVSPQQCELTHQIYDQQFQRLQTAVKYGQKADSLKIWRYLYQVPRGPMADCFRTPRGQQLRTNLNRFVLQHQSFFGLSPSSQPTGPHCDRVLWSYDQQLARLTRLSHQGRRQQTDPYHRYLTELEQRHAPCFGQGRGAVLAKQRRELALGISPTDPADETVRDDPSTYRRWKKKKTPLLETWRRPRFWWSTQLGGFYHFFTPFASTSNYREVNLSAFLMGLRLGYGVNKLIFSGVAEFGIGDGKALHLGVNLGFPFTSFFTLEVGTGLTFLWTDLTSKQPATFEFMVPLEFGIGFRIPIANRFAVGFRFLTFGGIGLDPGSLSMGLRGTISFEAL